MISVVGADPWSIVVGCDMPARRVDLLTPARCVAASDPCCRSSWLPKDAAAISRVVIDMLRKKIPSDSSKDQRAQPLKGPPTWRVTVDEIWSAVHRGGARGGRLSIDGACNQEPDCDTRRRYNDLDRFGPSDRRNTLRPVSLVYCIDLG